MSLPSFPSGPHVTDVEELPAHSAPRASPPFAPPRSSCSPSLPPFLSYVALPPAFTPMRKPPRSVDLYDAVKLPSAQSRCSTCTSPV